MRNYNKERSLRIWELAALLALSISLCAGAWAEARQSSISSQLIRLHVIAASDETQEQEIKLRVRDAVLEYLAPRLDGAADAEAARELIAANTDGIAKAAESAAEGRTVRVTLGRERYPTRRYDGFALPAGEYESLRVILGEGEGHNWWCVAFPSLCLSATSEEFADKAVGAGFPDSLTGALDGEEKYEVRFFLLDALGELEKFLYAG